MSLPKKVVIDDVNYIPIVKLLNNDCGVRRVKRFLFEIFYIFYFDHWHRKNGPISSCIEGISPEFMLVIETEDINLIKKSVEAIGSDVFIDTVLLEKDGVAINDFIAKNEDCLYSGSHQVTVGGVKYVPLISINNRLCDSDVKVAMMALAEAYLCSSDDYNALKDYVRERLLVVFGVFSPDLKELIESNKHSVVYDFLSKSGD